MADTTHIIECPACGKAMKKIYIESAGCCIDICTDGCGGIFFDNRELNKFDELHESVEAIVAELEGKDFARVDEKEVRICPVCNIPMVKMGAGVADIKIDVCNVCGGKFLDNGELERIREAKAINTDGMDKLFEKIYNRELDDMLGKNKNARPLTGNLRKAFEQIVYKSLMK